MLITIIPEHEMDATTDSKIREGLCECFPDDVSVFSTTRAWHGSSPHWTIIAEQEGEVAAHCAIVDRVIAVGNQNIRVAGIQNVFVRPNFRGAGLCNQIMSAATTHSLQQHFDCGLLFCIPCIESIYTQCGWRSLGTRDVIRIDSNGSEVQIAEKNIAMYIPLNRPDFPDGLIHLKGNDW